MKFLDSKTVFMLLGQEAVRNYLVIHNSNNGGNTQGKTKSELNLIHYSEDQKLVQAKKNGEYEEEELQNT